MLRFLLIYSFLNVANNGLTEVGAQKFFAPRIFGGSNAPKGIAPYMVALVLGERIKSFICGGSLISQNHILTAAHCIEAVTYPDRNRLKQTLYGMVGSNCWMSTKTTFEFNRYIIHPKWNNKTIKNDIGVLISKNKLELNERVQVIGLNFDWVDEELNAFVTGWGLTAPKEINNVMHLAPTPAELQILHVKTLTPQQCFLGMKNVPDYLKPTSPDVDPEIEICTFHSVGHSMCNGDSGSALVTDESMEQIGIVSWGFCNNRAGVPDVYVRISGYKYFVTNIVNSEMR